MKDGRQYLLFGGVKRMRTVHSVNEEEVVFGRQPAFRDPEVVSKYGQLRQLWFDFEKFDNAPDPVDQSDNDSNSGDVLGQAFHDAKGLLGAISDPEDPVIDFDEDVASSAVDRSMVDLDEQSVEQVQDAVADSSDAAFEDDSPEELLEIPPSNVEPPEMDDIDEAAALSPVVGAVSTIAQQRAEWAGIRESVYAGCFGQYSHVSSPQSSVSIDHAEPAISVYVHPPTASRPFTTVVTSGLSDRHMSVPQGRCSSRAELVMYVREMHPAYIHILRSLGEIPHRHDRGFWYGGTMSNGAPPLPIFTGSVLDSFVFMMPNIEDDYRVQESTSIGDSPLQLLWVVPITCAERAYIQQQGMKEFCRLLNTNRHGLMLNPYRSCYIGPGSTVAV